MKKLFFSIIASIIFSTVSSHNAYAVSVPQFPLCVAPTGTIKVSYPNGTHGIVGSSLSYTGSDTVYQVNSEQLTQCFCPESGQNGIQTNWLKTTGLSEDDINVLKKDGWIFIPNGTLWGLDESSYLAKNSDYTCKGSIGTGTSQGSSTGSSNASSTGTGGSVLSGAIQALAGTGNSVIMYSIFLIGLLLLSVFVALRKFQK